jgi:hypothetical protein
VTQADFEVLESRIREELSNIDRLGEETIAAQVSAGHRKPYKRHGSVP